MPLDIWPWSKIEWRGAQEISLEDWAAVVLRFFYRIDQAFLTKMPSTPKNEWMKRGLSSHFIIDERRISPKVILLKVLLLLGKGFCHKVLSYFLNPKDSKHVRVLFKTYKFSSRFCSLIMKIFSILKIDYLSKWLCHGTWNFSYCIWQEMKEFFLVKRTLIIPSLQSQINLLKITHSHLENQPDLEIF